MKIVLLSNFLNIRTGKGSGGNRHLPIKDNIQNKPSFEQLTKSPLKAKKVESVKNPRARSAKLRAAIRTSHPVWDMEVIK